MPLFALLLCFSLGFTHAFVDFTNSALYDINDFRGVKEVHIPKCDTGCLIFAATTGDEFEQFPDGLDPYANNLLITNNDNGQQHSIARLAQQRDNFQRKIPLTIVGHGNISVVNSNHELQRKTVFTIVLYVVEKNRADQLNYEVYDAFYTRGTTFRPQSDIVTFLSAYNFRVQSPSNIQSNEATVRLVGFDNALDSNVDGCPYVYKTPDNPTFAGFSIMANAPVVSIVIGKKDAISLQTDYVFNSVRDLSIDGFFSSPGWNGCAKPNNGGFQSFRTPDDLMSDSYLLQNHIYNFTVTMDILPNFDSKHQLNVTEGNDLRKIYVVTGTQQQQLVFPNTHYLINDFQNMRSDQGFIVRYTSTVNPRLTTTTSYASTLNQLLGVLLPLTFLLLFSR